MPLRRALIQCWLKSCPGPPGFWESRLGLGRWAIAVELAKALAVLITGWSRKPHQHHGLAIPPGQAPLPWIRRRHLTEVGGPLDQQVEVIPGKDFVHPCRPGLKRHYVGDNLGAG